MATGQQGHSELRLRVGGVELTATGETREAALRRMGELVRELEQDVATAQVEADVPEARYRLTPAGEGYLQGYLQGYRDGQGVGG